MYGKHEGPTCMPSEVAFSTTHRQPYFEVPNFQVAPIKWYRAVAPDFTWEPHDMRDSTQGVYSDLQTVAIPTPPAPIGNGLYDNKWNHMANEKYVPWLLPSKYRVRYVWIREWEHFTSDWSEYTEDYVSAQYTTPSLKAQPGPENIFQIEWDASGYYITMPSNNYYQEFNMTFNDVSHWGLSMPIGQIWPPGDVMMPVANFVNAWNSLYVGRYPWLMNLLPDGRLQLTVVHGGTLPGTNFWLFDKVPGNEWWPLTGFDTSGVWQIEEPITATESVAMLASVLRSGLEFVDGV
jgi:hypothetical protein